MSDLSKRSREVFEPLREASVERLPYLLMKFLQSARRADGSLYASGTINTNFNGICNILATRETQPVNVKGDPIFKRVLEMLKLRSGLSAADGRGAGCEAKRPVTSEHLQLAIAAGTIGRKSPKSLVTAVYLGAVLGWGCRAGAECHMIQNQDLLFGPDDRKNGVPEWIELSGRITKTRKGNPGDERELIPRIFPDDEFPDTCYVRTVLQYQSMKSSAQKGPQVPFFLNVFPAASKNPQKHQLWYLGTGKASSGIMGIHMLENLLTDALEAAGIDCKVQKYSAISLRKSMLQSGVDCNVPDLHLSRLAGHKALVSKKAYVNSVGLHHKTTERVIHRQLFHNVNRGYNKEMREVDAAGKKKTAKDGELSPIRSQSSSPTLGSRRSLCNKRSSVGRKEREHFECRPGTSRSSSRDERHKVRGRSESLIRIQRKENRYLEYRRETSESSSEERRTERSGLNNRDINMRDRRRSYKKTRRFERSRSQSGERCTRTVKERIFRSRGRSRSQRSSSLDKKQNKSGLSRKRSPSGNRWERGGRLWSIKDGSSVGDRRERRQSGDEQRLAFDRRLSDKSVRGSFKDRKSSVRDRREESQSRYMRERRPNFHSRFSDGKASSFEDRRRSVAEKRERSQSGDRRERRPDFCKRLSDRKARSSENRSSSPEGRRERSSSVDRKYIGAMRRYRYRKEGQFSTDQTSMIQVQQVHRSSSPKPGPSRVDPPLPSTLNQPGRQENTLEQYEQVYTVIFLLHVLAIACILPIIRNPNYFH